MGLLHDVQEAVVQEGNALGPILLRLRLLAARLGSKPLEEWVTHESEGYPRESPVPPYRQVAVTYKGMFMFPGGRYIQNAQIPGSVVESLAGKQWTTHEIRDGIAVVDDLVKRSSEGGGELGINASDLMLMLQGKVYEGSSCNEVRGTVSAGAMANLQYAVRSRILELTLEIEKAVPGAAAIAFGSPEPGEKSDSQKVTQIAQQIIHGNVTTISSSGAGSQFNVSFGQRDNNGFIDYLVRAGIPKRDASALAAIVAAEEPSSIEEPFGKQAKAWLAKNLKKAADGTWEIGIAVATRVLTEAALQYYGLR